MTTALGTVVDFLEGHGLTPAQAAGVAGNLTVESSLNPNALNTSEGAIGIAQWEGGRRTSLDTYAQQTGGSATSITTQLGFLWQELTGPEHNALLALEQTTTPAAAAAVFDQDYERSAGTTRTKRIADADSIYQQITGGTPTAAATSTADAANAADAGYNPDTAAAEPASLLGDIAGPFIGFGIEFGFAAVGLAIIVAGIYRMTKPALAKTAETAATIGKLTA